MTTHTIALTEFPYVAHVETDQGPDGPPYTVQGEVDAETDQTEPYTVQGEVNAETDQAEPYTPYGYLATE